VNKRAVAEEKPPEIHSGGKTPDSVATGRHDVSQNAVPNGAELDGKMFERLIEVTSEAAKGNIETRALHCDPSTRMGALAISVNHLLDMTDAFMREAGASMEHASEDKF